MPFIKQIDSYQIWIASYDNFNEWKANITLSYNNAAVVDLRFVDNPATYASYQVVQPTGISQIYDRIDRFPLYVDILRNEKPLYVALYESVTGSFAKCLLGTSREPVGEAELAAMGLMPAAKSAKKTKKKANK